MRQPVGQTIVGEKMGAEGDGWQMIWWKPNGVFIRLLEFPPGCCWLLLGDGRWADKAWAYGTPLEKGYSPDADPCRYPPVLCRTVADSAGTRVVAAGFGKEAGQILKLGLIMCYQLQLIFAYRTALSPGGGGFHFKQLRCVPGAVVFQSGV